MPVAITWMRLSPVVSGNPAMVQLDVPVAEPLPPRLFVQAMPVTAVLLSPVVPERFSVVALVE